MGSSGTAGKVRMLSRKPHHAMIGQCLEDGIEGKCADCGRPMLRRTPLVDPDTHSHVELCSACIVAFLQRQQFQSGCCG